MTRLPPTSTLFPYTTLFRSRAREAAHRDGPRRRDPPRLDHAPGARVQPRRPPVGPHALGWYGPGRALPAEALLRRRAEHRRRRLALDLRHLPRRHRLPHG